jgi:hypothetical protein
LILHQCPYRGLVLVTKLALPWVHKGLELGTGTRVGIASSHTSLVGSFCCYYWNPPKKIKGSYVYSLLQSQVRGILGLLVGIGPIHCVRKKNDVSKSVILYKTSELYTTEKGPFSAHSVFPGAWELGPLPSFPTP